MRVSTRITGGDKIAAQMRQMSRESRIHIKQEITRGALTVEASAKRLVQRGPATGAVVTKYSPRRVHQASAPGEAPATDTGTLASSIHAKVDSDGFGAEVEAAAEYAAALEFGTSTMAPRPFLLRALNENRKQIVKRVQDALRRAARRAASR
jgi:HK97 gp10 family phage protein